MTTPSSSVPVLIPSVELISAPRVTLELIAIAAGVFALVVTMLWLYVPSEAIWLLIFVLTAKRRRLMEHGLDLVLEAGPRSRLNPSHARIRG